MPSPYSLDLRERVIAACDAGERPEDLAAVFSVSARTIYNWLALRKQTGALGPREGDVGRDALLAPHAEEVRALVQKHPDATLDELREMTPVKVSIGALWNFLDALGITRKKEGPSRRRAASS